MAKRSPTDEAAEALDQALRQTDPINRMMLIERALKLHRQALEARESKQGREVKRGGETAPHPRR